MFCTIWYIEIVSKLTCIGNKRELKFIWLSTFKIFLILDINTLAAFVPCHNTAHGMPMSIKV